MNVLSEVRTMTYKIPSPFQWSLWDGYQKELHLSIIMSDPDIYSLFIDSWGYIVEQETPLAGLYSDDLSFDLLMRIIQRMERIAGLIAFI